MKRFLLVTLSLFVFAVNFYGVSFKDLTDDRIIVKVGNIEITTADLKLYMSGYHSITVWDRYSVETILNKMIFNLLYMNACIENKLFITDVEMDYYTKKFFDDRSINYQDQTAVELFFSQNEPYSCAEDFFIKSSLYMNKVKYLASKGYLKQVKTDNIFFPIKNLNKTEKLKLRDSAELCVREIIDGVPFDFVKSKNSTNNDLRLIEKKSNVKKSLNEKDIDRILQAGLFNPIFVDGKDGFYIFLNYEYIFPEDEKLVEGVTEELSKKYEVTKFVSFTDK